MSGKCEQLLCKVTVHIWLTPKALNIELYLKAGRNYGQTKGDTGRRTDYPISRLAEISMSKYKQKDKFICR